MKNDKKITKYQSLHLNKFVQFFKNKLIESCKIETV